MATSFLSPAEAAEFNAALRDLFATRLQMGPTVTLMLYRGTNDQQYGPTIVLVSYAKREAQSVSGPAGGVTESDGEFAAWAPWDVKRDDRFRMPSGTTGVIKLVEEPTNGIQRARFSIQAGA